MKSWLLWLGLLTLTGFVVVQTGGCGISRKALFPRPAAPPGTPRLPPEAEALWLGAEANVEAWFLRPQQGRPPAPVVIFAHGNGELIDHWGPWFRALPASGVAALLVEYPGYGRSQGSPSQNSITEIMLAAYDFLRSQPDIDAERIVAHGRSLGGGAVCALARQRPLAALVLESTFTSVPAIATSLGFPSFLVLDVFDNLEAVSELEIPMLVLHGERDDLIPIAHAEALAAAAGTEVVRRPCGHNDCPFAWPRIERFLTAQGVLP